MAAGMSLDASDHRDADEGLAVHRDVVVEHGHRDQSGIGVAEHLAHGRCRCVTAPDDRHPQAARPCEPRCQAKMREWKRMRLMPAVAKISPTTTTDGCTN